MGLEFLRLRALHQPQQIHILQWKQCTQHIRGAEKKSWDCANLCESFETARRIDRFFFGSAAGKSLQDCRANSRATTEQTTRLKFGWLGPLSTLRLNQAHSLSVFIFCPKRPPWCSLIWYLIIDNLILVADKITYIYLLYLLAKAGGLICENVCFHAMCTNAVSVSGWSPVGCEGFHTNVSIPSPLPTTLIFC